MTAVEKIINLLNENNISAAKMMRELGFSSGLFSQWKSGKQKPSAEKLVKIAEYFNVSADYLLGKEPTITEPSDNDIKFALFNGSEGITDEMFDEVKQFAEMVKLREEAKRKKQ